MQYAVVVYISSLRHKMKFRKMKRGQLFDRSVEMCSYLPLEIFRSGFLGGATKNQKYDKILRDIKLQFSRLISNN